MSRSSSTYDKSTGLDSGSHQQWTSEVWTKSVPKGKDDKNGKNLRDAQRKGLAVDTSAKNAPTGTTGTNLNGTGWGLNGQANGVKQKMWKLDQECEPQKLETVSKKFSQELVRLRVEKNLNRKQLAQAINEQVCVIEQYETGKAVPNGNILNKLRRIVGSDLPKVR
jgi:putative transcription factor